MQVITIIMSGKLIIFAAPSGSGKTTIIKRLLALGYPLNFSISATTRSPRSGEIDGKDYHFLSEADFRKHIEERNFVEWEEVYSGCFYGTLKSEIEKHLNQGEHVVFDVDVVGALNIKKEYRERALAIFVMPPSLEVLKERLLIRASESEETLQMRLAKAAHEMSFAPQFDLILVNNQIDDTVKEVREIIDHFLKL